MGMKKIKRVCQKLSPNAKAALVYTLAGLATRGLSVITVPIFTRIMTTAEIGTISVFNSWYSMLSVIATLSLTSGGFLVGMKEYAEKRDQYSSSVLTITTCMAILMAVTYVISPSFWNRLFDLPTELVILMLFGLLVAPARDFWMSKQRYEIKYKAVAIVSFGTAVIGTIFSILCVVWANAHRVKNVDVIRLYANYLVVYGVSLVIYIYIYAKGRTLYHKEYWTSSLKLSIPLIGNSLASQVLSVSDRTMINNLVGKHEVGIYGTLYNVSTLSGIVWQAMNSSFIPYMFQNMEKENERKNVRKYVNYILAGYAFVAFAMTMMAPEIVRILATEEYYEAIYLMPPIAAGIFLISLGNLYSNVLLYYKKTQFIMIATSIAAILNVALNAILIPVYGYQAAAYTTLIAYFVMALIEAVVSNKVEKQTLGEGSEFIYNNKLLAIISVALILLCLVCNSIYAYPVIRWSLILGMLLICLIGRKRIIKIVQEIRKR